MLKKRLLWIYLIGSVLATGIFLALSKSCNSGAVTKEASAKNQDTSTAQRHSVRALGRIEPGQGIINISAPGDSRLFKLEVREGDFVKTGDVLAFLDSYPEALAEVSRAYAQLNSAKGRLGAETGSAQATIRESALHLDNIKNTGPLEILAHESQLKILEVDLAMQTRELARMRSCDDVGVFSRQAIDNQEVAVNKARESLNHGRIVLDHLKKKHIAQLDEANARLSTNNAYLLKTRSTISIETLSSELQSAEARLARAKVVAPRDGRILKILTWPGERTGTTPILKMGDVSTMYAVAEVYETDIRMVRPGQRAVIRSAALPNDLTGKVSQVGLTIHKNDVLGIDPGAATDFRVVETRILLDDHQVPALFNHLQVDVEILLN